MIRRLAAAYVHLRSFPRDIFRLLNEINDRVAESADLHVLRGPSQHVDIDELRQEMVPFYADVTRSLLALHQTVIATAVRVENIARTVRRADAAASRSVDQALVGQAPGVAPPPHGNQSAHGYSAPAVVLEGADLVRFEALLNKVLIALERSTGPAVPR